MATAEDINDNPTEPEDKPDETPAPSYISKEAHEAEMKALRAEIKSTVTDAVQGVAAAFARQTPTPAAPIKDQWDDTPDVNEDDDENTKINKLVKKQLAPLVKEFRSALSQRDDATFGAIDELGNSVLEPKMKYLPKYKGEVEQVLASMAPHMRMNPQAKMTAYKLVMANHVDEIIASEVEAARVAPIRKETPTLPGAGRRTRVFDAEKEISPQDLGYSEDQIAEVERKFGDWDRFAAKTSGGRFKNYKDFAKARASQLGFEIKEKKKA